MFYGNTWTTLVFRELLQNSDDARSSAVEIRFETAAYLRRKDGAEANTSDAPPLLDLKSTHVQGFGVDLPFRVFSDRFSDS